MKNLRSQIMVIIALLFMVAGCGSGGSSSHGDGGNTSVSIRLGIPSSSVALQTVAASTPTVIGSIEIEITAANMNTITDAFNVSPGTTVTRSYEVPSGSGRKFVAKAYSGAMGSGNLLYQGEITIDLTEVSATVDISMALADIWEALRVLASGDILWARDLFKVAVVRHGGEVSNDADTANFFYALTRVAALWFDMASDGVDDGLNDAGDILDAFGCSDSGRDPINPDILCPDILPSNSPTGGDLQTFSYDVVRPELEGAIANLNAVSQSFNIQWTEPIDITTVESDYGDVLAFRAAAKGALANLLILYAYDLNADIDETENTDKTIEQFLADNPGFLTLTNPVHLSTAKSYLGGSAFDDIRDAILWMFAETDDQTDDLIDLLGTTPEEIAEAQANIADAKASLNGPTVMNDNESPSDPSDDFTLDLGPFFAGIDLRALLPAFVGDDATGFFPDTTFGSVLLPLEGGYDPSVLNDDLDEDDTADIFEEDIYYVYGGNDISGDTAPYLNIGRDPLNYGFDFLGAANSADGVIDFTGIYYTYYMVKGRDGIFDDQEVFIDALEFIIEYGEANEFCCSQPWWSSNLWWWGDVTGAPDSIGAWLEDDGFVLMTAPPGGTTTIRVYGLPLP